MRLTRVFVDAPLAAGGNATLSGDAAGHLLRVLRLGPGDDCVLFNGDGRDYAARIVSAGKRDALLEITGVHSPANESPLRIMLVQGIARGEKMDLILQKATELGVAGIVPVLAERTEVRLDAARTEKRIAHWRSVIVSACEQSGRATLPTLAAPAPLQAAATGLDANALKLTLDPAADASARDLPMPGARQIAIAIGPEGGWSPRDRSTLQAAGFSGLRLGPRILRTETAGLAAIAALQARFGDL